MGRIPINIADLVGGTPMVRLTRLLDGDAAEGVELYGKLEALNPGGSVKDRIGVAMIEAAERDGLIEPGRTHDRRGDLGQHRASRWHSSAPQRATTCASSCRRA